MIVNQTWGRPRPHPDPKVVTWPPMATAVLAHQHTLNLNLGAVTETLAELLSRYTLPDSSLLLIPVQSGVPLLRYTLRIFASGDVYPMPDEAQPWLDLIPPIKPMPCSDAVADAVETLRELSSLVWFDTQRNTGLAAQEAANAVISRFRDAMAHLDALPRDEIIARLVDEVESLALQVQREADDPTDAGTFAQAMTGALTGDQNDTMLNILGLVYIATQWDLDPASAEALLAGPAAEEAAP